MAQAEPVSEPMLVIVEFVDRPKFVGFPQCCPGSDCDVAPAVDEICTAELYDVTAAPIRQISGTSLKRNFKFRFTAHAIRRRAGSKMLALVRPFEDKGARGLFAQWWKGPRNNGEFCLGVEDILRWEDGPVRTAFLAGKAKTFKEAGDDRAYDWRCIKQ